MPATAKDIILRPITRQESDSCVKQNHYSGKVVNNSQLHIGVFLGGVLEGAMQFGPSLDKRKTMPLVEGTGWNEFIELNRMAFSDKLPRNSESRALSVAMRLLRKHAPQLKWVISFADGAQCGDGTIYRAAGFVLTSIKVNNQIWQMPDGGKFPAFTAKEAGTGARPALLSRVSMTKGKHITDNGGASMRAFSDAGAKPLPGFQLRYLYFLDPTARERLTVPVLPFSEIERRGARMYKGKPLSAASIDSDAPGFQSGEGGAEPTAALQT